MNFDILAEGNYQKARRLFLESFEGFDVPVQIDSLMFNEEEQEVRGVDGENLFIDAVRVGDPKARRVVVLSSGVHGIEGYAGAMAQLAALQVLRQHGFPVDTLFIFIFALNPYGMSWRRRTDHQNIDINRNFIDFSKSLPDSKDYLQLDRFLSQSIRPTLNFAGFVLFLKTAGRVCLAKATGARATVESVSRAVSGGQYVNSKGVFYGGRASSLSRRLIESFFDNEVLTTARESCLWIDLHSGLGPRGKLTAVLGSRALSKREVRKLSGAHRVRFSSIAQAGKIVDAMLEKFRVSSPEGSHLGMTIEIGTRGPVKVLADIRSEVFDSEPGKHFHSFFLPDLKWRESVIEGSSEMCRCILRSLRSS